MENIDAYPLCWPEGWPRTTERDRGQFKGTPDQVRIALIREIDLLVLGPVKGSRFTVRDSVIISTNVQLRRDGEPMAGRSNPTDPGVAVYFERKKKRVCFACDKYDQVWKNMRAIQNTIEALRGIERWGSSDMLDRAFTGFAALPAPGPRKWWDVLGLNGTESREVIRARYRDLARIQHPDNGGSTTLMAEINAAYEEATR